MHGVEMYERIRRARFLEGWGIRKIAREFRVHRRLVRDALAGAEPRPHNSTKKRKASSLGEHHGWIDELLRLDRTAPRKQRHTAKRIYERLVHERAYLGGESTVRRYLAKRKGELGIARREVYVPLHHPPGRDGQADWGDATVRINGTLWTANLLLLASCYSRAVFVQAFPMEKQEAMFEGLRRGGEFFDGVFHRLMLDNLRTAVKKVLQGRNRQEQDAFIAFRSHYLFESIFCLPGKQGAHEKGVVEGLVGYVRRNWLVPVRDFPSWEAFNHYLLERCRQDQKRKAQGKSETIETLLAREQPLLLPLPEHPFDCCRKLLVRGDSHSRIRVDGIRYSIPTEYAYRQLLAKVYAEHIVVVDADRVVARHRRRYTCGEDQLDPIHYLGALKHKPHLLDFGLPFVNWRLPSIFGDLRQKLEKNGPGGLREYARVLQAIPQSDIHTVACAVDEALSAGEQTAEDILGRLARLGVQVPPTKEPARPLRIASPRIEQYDQLATKEARDGN